MLPRFVTTVATLLFATCAHFATSWEAHAACVSEGSETAWGDFWIERSGANCDCDIYMREFDCVKNGANRTAYSPTRITTVSGACDTACEALPGYDSAIATVLAKYGASSGNYECDSTFTDLDQDGYGACIDEDDTDPRVWARINEAETVCDGVDNDNDGTADDGIGSCAEDHDHKRTMAWQNAQGRGEAQANLVDGQLIRYDVDATLQGPHGALTLSRTYDSRRDTADAAVGKGWTHSFAVYLKEMPAGDGRWQVQTPSGEMQYFRCESYEEELPSDLSCVIDDHRPAGNLRRIDDVFFFYPGDGSRYRFDDTVTSGRRAYDQHTGAGGLVISTAEIDGSGRIEKVMTANTALYFHFTYGTYGLDAVRLNSTSTNQILDYDVASNGRLEKVKFASAIGTIDSDTFVAYAYDGSTENLETVTSKIDGSTTVTLAIYDYDGSDRVITIEDANQDLTIAYTSATVTTVTYNVASSGNASTAFTHNGLWVTTRNSDLHVGGVAARTTVRDEHGRMTCTETDDSIMTKYIYTDAMVANRVDEYGKTGSCTSGGSVQRKRWRSWDYNTDVQAWRLGWHRARSVYSPASDCTGGSVPSGCREVKYDYVSSTDDRIQWVTETGNTKLINGSTSLRIRKHRYYYFGLDTGTCTSGDSYAGRACRVEQQDNSSNVLARRDFTYVPSGGTGGLLKTTAQHDRTSDPAPLTTTFASHTAFGLPGSITDPAGVQRDFTYNGWGDVTLLYENDVLLDTADSPAVVDRQTNYSYNKLRRIDTITLPKGNKQVFRYFTGTGGFGRTKAYANADSSSALQEIMRYDYDNFGRELEEKILDSINGTTPCADEDCVTYETRSQDLYDAAGRLLESYLHATDTSNPPDATRTHTYTDGKLVEVEDFRGNTTEFEYDDLGRTATVAADVSGVGAATGYSYDENDRILTVTSPTGVVTTTEHDDFGQRVLERSTTRGDIRTEYDLLGRQVQRRRTPYNSSSTPEDVCYSHDWLGRLTAIDLECANGTDWTLKYDGDDTPSGSCVSGTVQTGRLSMYYGSSFKRVLCYHPGGLTYAVFQRNDSSTWAHSSSLGSRRVYDLNGNLKHEYVHDRPDTHANAREIEYVYDSVMKDRIQRIRHRLTSTTAWTYITSDSTDPTYFAFGGMKTVPYANNIVETNTYNKARWLTRRKTQDGGSGVYTDVNLTYDVGGNITLYDDSAGFRHLKYYTAYDGMNRLRCSSRAAIGSCSGGEPWSDKFIESFDYDDSGNRTNRRYGEFNTADDDAYVYESGSDVIDKIVSSGSDQEMSNSMKGEIVETNGPQFFTYVYGATDRMEKSEDNYLGAVEHYYSEPFGDRYRKTSVCNDRETYYYYSPHAGGTSHEAKLIDLFNTCESEFPRQLRTYVYLEGRPIAVVHSERGSGSAAQDEVATYWVHTDQLGTPILVSDDVGREAWRWENDPFGRTPPVEFEVTASDVNPDDDPAGGGGQYDTCCCTVCGVSDCGAGTSGCSAGCCAGASSQAVVWTKTYTVTGANNVRVHFSAFDVAAGASRTAKDFVRLKTTGGDTIADLTGGLGGFWSPWIGEGEDAIVVELHADNVQDSTAGFVIDELEYTKDDNGRYVMHLRMPGQIWDKDVTASYNFQRWYRSEDGRYLSPDPIGLTGGAAGYSAYVGGNPLRQADPDGLLTRGVTNDRGLECRDSARASNPTCVGFTPNPSTLRVGVDCTGFTRSTKEELTLGGTCGDITTPGSKLFLELLFFNNVANGAFDENFTREIDCDCLRRLSVEIIKVCYSDQIDLPNEFKGRQLYDVVRPNVFGACGGGPWGAIGCSAAGGVMCADGRCALPPTVCPSNNNAGPRPPPSQAGHTTTGRRAN